MKKPFIFTFLFIIAFAMDIFSQSAPNPIAVELVETQVRGYNARNIDLFLQPYSDTVKVFDFPGVFAYQGKEEMRKRYSKKFADLPDLHCKIVNRMSLNDVVIDQEYVTQVKGKPSVEVFALYKIKEDKITEVHFIRPARPVN